MFLLLLSTTWWYTDKNQVAAGYIYLSKPLQTAQQHCGSWHLPPSFPPFSVIRSTSLSLRRVKLPPNGAGQELPL